MALRLRGATSGYIELKAPASAGDNTLTLPVNNGSANQLLKTDGSGNLSWVDDNSGVSLSGSTNNTIATVTGANALAGEANLTFDGNDLIQTVAVDGKGLTLTAGDLKPMIIGNANRSSASNTIFGISGKWNNTEVGRIAFEAGTDTTNKDDGKINFYTRVSGGTLTSKLLIETDGDVGIGTSSPGQKLHIYEAAADSQCYLKIQNNRSRNAAVMLTTTQGSWYVGQGIGADVDRFSIYDSEERLSIDSTGAVGIACVPKDNDGNYRQLQIGLGAHFYGRTDDTPIYLSSNGYRDSSSWKYTANTTASRIAMATNMTFKTAVSGTAGNAISWQERMTIWNGTGDVELHAGNLKLASGKGIMFHPHDEAATTNGSDSNLLDDYEEGTFQLSFGTSGTAFSTVPTLSQNNCRYTKIGNTVTISAYVGWGNQGAGGSGNLLITGLPFAQNSAAVYNGAYFGWYAFGGGFDADTILQAYISNGGTSITLLKTTTGDTSPSYTAVPPSAVVGLTGTYQLSMTYTV
jgi:hypothetical protein